MSTTEGSNTQDGRPRHKTTSGSPTNPIAPPWAGTPYEPWLKQIRLDPARATAFPLHGIDDELVHTQFWTWLYATLQRIKQISQQPASRPPSKQAARLKDVAKQLRKLAANSDIAVRNPAFAPEVENLAKALCSDAASTRHSLAQAPRHSQHPETSAILVLMALVYHETGTYHDSELSALLRIVGIHQMTPEALRVLRARNKFN